jgi:Asp/Glu/hydantoin racemase
VTLVPPAPAAPFLGVLMLETRFPRLPGDVGNPSTFDFAVRHAVVRGASARRVVQPGDPQLLEPFLAAARALVREGAAAVTTSCGFLVLYQATLQAALDVPVWTSSLLRVPELQAQLAPHERVGIVTVDAASLAASHLRAAGADPATPYEGLAPGCAFQRALLDDAPAFDPADAEAATVQAAQNLVRRRPDVAAIVLECTNMPPYADAVRRATGRPVHDLTTLLRERYDSRGPRAGGRA